MYQTTSRAKHFLETIHKGACSVPDNHPLAYAFVLLEKMEQVTTRPSGTPGFLDVYSKGFKPRYAGKGEL